MPLLEQCHWLAPGITPALMSTPFSAHRSLEAASWAQIYQKLQNFYRGTQVECGQGLARDASPYFVLAHGLCPSMPGRAGMGAGTTASPSHKG